jgi:chemotaxis protein CheD
VSVKDNRVFVAAGAIAVGSRSAVLTTLGLGSCVAVAIDDPVAAIGGLSHIFLPAPPTTAREFLPARYVTTAVPLLVERLVASGARRSRLRARMAGGAVMFPELLSSGIAALGPRNADAAREMLAEMKIPLLGEDVGGNYGRSVSLYLADGRMVVKPARAPEVVL